MSSSDARSFFAMRRGYREIYCLIGFTSLNILEIATARTPWPRGYVLSPEWTTSRLLSFRSFIALRMDGVRRGELVRLISNPRRRPPETIKRSSSLPATATVRAKYALGNPPLNQRRCRLLIPTSSRASPFNSWKITRPLKYRSCQPIFQGTDLRPLLHFFGAFSREEERSSSPYRVGSRCAICSFSAEVRLRRSAIMTSRSFPFSRNPRFQSG